MTAYAINGWTREEQQAWIDAPSGPDEFHDCIGIVDATYVEVERPKQYALERTLLHVQEVPCGVLSRDCGQTWSALMSTTACAQAFVSCSSCRCAGSVRLRCWSGRIRYLDGGNSPRGGSELSAMVKARRVFLRPGLFLLGDVAYVNDERCKTGYKAPQLDPARVGAAEAARRRLYNQRLSALRIRVEHAFSRLKHTWQLFQNEWKLPLDRLAPAFRACALLTNFLAVERDLYM